MSGVSITLAGPNSEWRPSVARKTPPFFPTSSPRITTRWFLSISSLRAEFIACTIVICMLVPTYLFGELVCLSAEVQGLFRVDVIEEAPHVWMWELLRPGDRLLHLVVHGLSGV